MIPIKNNIRKEMVDTVRVIYTRNPHLHCLDQLVPIYLGSYRLAGWGK